MRTSIFRRYERESALRGFPDVQVTCPPLPSRKGAGFRLACNTSTASSHGRTSTCRFNRARSSAAATMGIDCAFPPVPSQNYNPRYCSGFEGSPKEAV
ncbi:hypothetical protein B0H10DRAFT_586699 [Mycena sp. CBHHK59/15]|nr:hypothetical protein B0H10DRAFT_586699 [Mycena sp. CBHHK59/15]